MSFEKYIFFNTQVFGIIRDDVKLMINNTKSK